MADEPIPAGGEPAAPVTSDPAPAAEPVAAAVPEGVAALAAEAAPEPAAEPDASAVDAEPLAADVEAKPEGEGEQPPADAGPAEAAVPTYETFNLPDGVTAEPAMMSAYTNILGKYGLTQDAGQELLDFHANVVKQAQDRMAQQQQDVFAETRAGWVKDVEKRFGNRRDTTLNDAKWAIENLVTDAKDRRELFDVLAFSGVGDHPAVINAFAKAAKRMRERTAPPPGLPVDPNRSKSPADRRYGRGQS